MENQGLHEIKQRVLESIDKVVCSVMYRHGECGCLPCREADALYHKLEALVEKAFKTPEVNEETL